MKVGLQINQFNFEDGNKQIGPKVGELATAADEAGFASIWVMDHFFQIQYLGPKTDPMLEAYTTLGYIAGRTKRARLGTMVTGVVYREPAVLIKAVTTLDVLSGGRAYFGIGAGWNEEEAIGLGLPRPLAGDRLVKLEETLKIAQQMWSGDTKPINGKEYRLQEPISSPQPVSKPYPPILIGGGGEQKTLRMVAQYGDACNLFAASDVAHKLDVLRKHCEDLGRDYGRIEKTVLIQMDIAAAATNPDEVVKRATALAKLGITHIIFANGRDDNLAHYETIGSKLLPQLAKL